MNIVKKKSETELLPSFNLQFSPHVFLKFGKIPSRLGFLNKSFERFCDRPTSESQLNLTFWVVKWLMDNYNADDGAIQRHVIEYILLQDLEL